MSIADSIAKTARRIGNVEKLLLGPGVRALYEGIAVEFGRVSEYKDIVQCATVPSSSLCPEAIDDLESKYGVSSYGESTEQQRIDRIVERATLFGSGAAGWLEAQIQAAGFPLYVVENVPTYGVETQMGDVQMDITTQLGTMPSRIDPSTVPGILIASSPNRKGGGVISPTSQLGVQMGSGTQMGSLDTDYSYPQPAERNLPTDATLWGAVFFLSPIEGRIATEDEMLFISDERIQYLKKLVMQIKYLGRWCVAQVAQRVVRVTSDGSVRVIDDGSTRRA